MQQILSKQILGDNISDIDFRGYIAPQGFSSIKLETCDICKKNPPDWIETRGMGDLIEFRMSCESCHNEFLNKVDDMEVQKQIEDFSIYDQLPPENEDATPAERPAWMEEFIEEGRASGNVQNLAEDTNKSDVPEENEISMEDSSASQPAATWTAGFVKEALFGSNPESWLEAQGGFEESQIDATIETLGSLFSNSVGSVKLSAILCLAGIAKRNSSKNKQVIEELNRFLEDSEETVQSYAKESISKIK